MHPGDGELQSLIDGELEERGSRRIQAHLESCETCRSRRKELELELRQTAELLRSLDREPPQIAVEDVIRRAERRTIPRRAGSRRALLAASVAAMLVTGGVVAAIVPGSPVREIVERLVGGPEPEAPPRERATEPWGQEAGVAWIPRGAVEIAFETRQPEGSIELIRTGDDTARVEVRGDSIGFVVADGSILVHNRGSRASYRIAVPEGVSDIRVRVGSRTVYEMSGGRVLQDEFREEGVIPLSEEP